MDEKALKRRSWIKNIAIIFLAVMLVLTFFSRTIMNYSLPEIAAQYSSSGTITSRIRGSGTVEANQTYAVTMPGTRKIKDVGIKTGTAVAEGDVLFILEALEESDLLQQKELELETAKTRYQYPEYSELLMNIEKAQIQLRQDREKLNSAGSNSLSSAELNAQLKELEKSIRNLEKDQSSLESKINRLTADADTDLSLTEANQAYDAMKIKYEELQVVVQRCQNDVKALKETQSTAQDAVDDIQYEIDRYNRENSGSSVTQESLLSMQRNIEKAQRDLNAQKEDYDYEVARQEIALHDLLVKRESAYQAADAALKVYLNAPEGQKDALKAAYDQADQAAKAADAAYTDAQLTVSETLSRLQRAIDDARISLMNLQVDYENAQKAYNSSSTNDSKYNALQTRLNTAQDNLRTVTRKYEAAQEALSNAQEEYAEAERQMNESKEVFEQLTDYTKRSELEAELDEVLLQHDIAVEQREELQELIENIDNYDTLRLSVIDREIALNTANSTYEQAKKEISDLEAEIAEIKSGNTDTEVLSPVAGVVSSVTAIAGQEYALKDTIAEIQLVERGYAVQFTITTEQSRRIKEGDPATVQYYWGGDISATVVSIKPDTSNPSQNRIVTLNVVGDINIGQNLTFTLGERGASYDTIVPNSAIREDNNGKFVLSVTAKSTPLGNRYTATRVDVEVLASDDTSSAITGLMGGEYVITTSSKPISAGMQVRLNETS